MVAAVWQELYSGLWKLFCKLWADTKRCTTVAYRLMEWHANHPLCMIEQGDTVIIQTHPYVVRNLQPCSSKGPTWDLHAY